MREILFFLTILIALSFTFSVSAQDSDFDPFKLKAEYFQDGDVKDSLEFSDKKGRNFKIINSKSSKELLIKKDENWLRHGVFYSFSNGKVTSKSVYNYGEEQTISCKECLSFDGVIRSRVNTINKKTYYTYRYFNLCTTDIQFCWDCEYSGKGCRTIKAGKYEDFTYPCGQLGLDKIRVECE